MILGQGAFGRVMKAEAVGIGDSQSVTTVAVKMVKGKTFPQVTVWLMYQSVSAAWCYMPRCQMISVWLQVGWSDYCMVCAEQGKKTK